MCVSERERERERKREPEFGPVLVHCLGRG